MIASYRFECLTVFMVTTWSVIAASVSCSFTQVTDIATFSSVRVFNSIGTNRGRRHLDCHFGCHQNNIWHGKIDFGQSICSIKARTTLGLVQIHVVQCSYWRHDKRSAPRFDHVRGYHLVQYCSIRILQIHTSDRHRYIELSSGRDFDLVGNYLNFRFSSFRCH